MKEAFWKSDRFLGIALTLIFLVIWGRLQFLEGLERDAYDLGVRLSSRDPGNQIAVIAIDDSSIKSIGRWPWSREIHAQMLDKLKAAGAKVIGSTIFYAEVQVDPGLTWIQRLKSQLTTVASSPGGEEIAATLKAAEQALDTDGILGTTIKDGGNVVLPMHLEDGEPIGNPDAPLPDYIKRFAIPKQNILDPSGQNQDLIPRSTVNIAPPIPAFGENAAAIGHLIVWPDVDGDIRFEPLIVRYYDDYFPSLSLMIAAKSLNVGVDEIKINLGDSVQLKNLNIKTNPELFMNTFYYGKREGDREPFDVFSFIDVIQDKVPAESFKDKIVLLGATAYGVGSTLHTPTGDVGGPALVLAHTVASILNQNFFVQPGWAGIAEFLVLLLVGAYLIFLLPRLKAGRAFLISGAIFVALIVIELGLMKSQATWLKLMTAVSLLAIGHVLLTTKRFLVTEASKLRLDVDSAASNKQLALQFQQKGELDNAFEYFRKCPADDNLLESMYSLATDFQVKRKPEKAMLVYEYIYDKNPKFRDIQNKITQAKQAMDTLMLYPSGSPPGGAARTTILQTGAGGTKTMLGRYEVERELGKGAMGVVYLGKDPKINRVVAIKTMALSQEFEADELDEVKSRFFREAETAGRLQHPNIVTIYDAGEEHDLAYIAMEFLEGHDLARYTKPDSLLPLPITMGVIFKAALALDFAHKQNVVHRDIKPANIMYEPNKKTVKLTDFGIARITDSSKTKTGMVLGTPSYMSPEQLSGKKVDGRSDLFSLGVMLYQMVTGKLPFMGESMATLMYKIANEPHQDIATFKPDLARQRPCIPEIIDKALQKDADKRYQTGADMARDIQACAKQVGDKG
ncbi:MAG: CHASE2 domain-containing protein [Gammaproteobacteria bacterium]|nr:CHASE2 domain-containing protein [Gammaproteobacteria bacterium]